MLLFQSDPFSIHQSPADPFSIHQSPVDPPTVDPSSLDPFAAYDRYLGDLSLPTHEAQTSPTPRDSLPLYPSHAYPPLKSASKPPPPARFHKHEVTHQDTLPGIALRYGVSAYEIKRLNRMPTDEVFAFSSLLVPVHRDVAARLPPPAIPSPETTRRFQTAAFQKRTLATEGEAQAYLIMADGDYKEAFALWERDRQWEEQQSGNPHPPPPLRLLSPPRLPPHRPTRPFFGFLH